MYLTPFEVAVKKAGLASVMNSYAELDGVPCGASRELLTKTLRDTWGFQGLVVSDYFAIHMLKEYHEYVADDLEAAIIALRAGKERIIESIYTDLPSHESMYSFRLFFLNTPVRWLESGLSVTRDSFSLERGDRVV